MPTIRDKIKKIVRNNGKNKKGLSLKHSASRPELVADPGSGFDAADPSTFLNPPHSATTRPGTAISAFAPRLETPPMSPTSLLPPSPPFSRNKPSRSRSTTNSSARPESSDSYASIQNQTATTSNITTPPNGQVAGTPTSTSRMSLSRFKWGSRISLRSSYSEKSETGDRESRRMSRDSTGLQHAHEQLGTSLGTNQIPLIEETSPEILSEDDDKQQVPDPLDLDYDFDGKRATMGLQEVNNYFGKYLEEDPEPEDHYPNPTGRSPYGQFDEYIGSPGPQQSTFDSAQLQSPMNRTFFGDDSASDTSSNYEKSFISHDSSSLHNYIAQFTAEEYRSAVGNIPRPPSRTSSECLPLDRFTDQNPSFEIPPAIPDRAAHRPSLSLDHSSAETMKDQSHPLEPTVTPPSPTRSTSPKLTAETIVETVQKPPIVHETRKEERTEVHNTHIVREIHTHEYRTIEQPIKDERPDSEKEVRSPVHLIQDADGNMWPVIEDERGPMVRMDDGLHRVSGPKDGRDESYTMNEKVTERTLQQASRS
ncbi:hypothetical protein BJ508DRAFT_124423 [Ascobolus immersus RN42]|uniref:Uncharacterized protein n=1 Tax=Ascobolus immersus RN42 TaxID=1160509 RepID=A0A3N4I9V7_ASCIM|nr:hypothetical protein BJ508DRAFT_124423 [Ascobolus immersus RN42]